ncbi:MAG: WD40/YVTN/BNR-like repeat-containing protein [Terriglobales bacterium]
MTRRPHILFAALLLAASCALGALPRLAGQQVPPSFYQAMRWRLIGPYRAGNVYAVAGVPGDPTTYYLGLPEGGVWKTSDGGTVWFPIFDQEHVPAVGSVAVAASNPAIVYVGTGDPTGWSFTPGEGMFKSTDGGRSWKKIGLDDTQNIPALLVDPRNPKIVLAGALGPRAFGPSQSSQARGVYRSSDGGRTWQHTLFVDARSGVENLAWDYRDPKVVYAAFAGERGFGPRAANAPPPKPILYKSTDEGKSWKPLPQTGLPKRLRGATIAVAAGTHGKVVYAELQGSGRDAQGIYRSDDGGKTWRLGTHQILSAGGRIYVDPQNPDVVYLMGTALYRSLDGGRSFRAYKGAPGGDDYRALWIDPSNPRRMIAGVDQGPTITVDGGQTWTPWFNLPNGQFYRISTDNQFPYWVYGPQQDSGTAGVRSRSDYGDIGYRDWYPVGGFEAGYIVVDPLNPRWIYTQGWYHVTRRFDRETGQVAVVYTPHGKDRFSGQPPLVFSPQDPHTLYLGAQYVLATSDGGAHWRTLSPDLTARPQPKPGPSAAPAVGARVRPTALESLAPSPVAAGEIWTGSSNGVIELTRDGGQTWQNVSPPELSATTAVEIIDASHHDAGTAYVAAADYRDRRPLLFRTTDFGRDWQPIVTGLPGDVRARSIREDDKDADLLFAGTEMGAWVSFDKGGHWQSLQLNLPNTVVSDLAVHGDDLAISTYGRALWILDDITPLRQIAAAQAAGGAYLFRPETAMRVRWSNNHDTPLPPEIPAGENPPEGAIIDYYLKAPAQGPMTLDIYDAAGQLVRQYTNTPPPPDTSLPNVAEYWLEPPAVLSAEPGMHRFVWDLRYPWPKALTYSYFGQLLDYTEYTLTWHAIKGKTPRHQPVGPLAIPGTYEVRLTVNGRTYSRPLRVVNDPRVPVSQADLEAQLAAEKRVMAGLAASYDAYYSIARFRDELAADMKAVAGNSALLAAEQSLDKKTEALGRGTGDSGFGAANRDLGRRLQDLEFGDLRPVGSTLAAIDQSCAGIAAAERQLAEIDAHGLPELNRLLTAAGHPALAAPVATGGCGE